MYKLKNYFNLSSYGLIEWDSAGITLTDNLQKIQKCIIKNICFLYLPIACQNSINKKNTKTYYSSIFLYIVLDKKSIQLVYKAQQNQLARNALLSGS